LISIQPLNHELYKEYGSVISTRSDVEPKSANLDTAKKYNWLSDFKNLKPGVAKTNVCLFRSNPMVQSSQTIFEVKILERHNKSTQIFIPMGNVKSYLVLVSLGESEPDLKTLKAFLATGLQGVSYHPGVWHHPLIAIEQESEFACFVHEDGSSEDCQVFNLNSKVEVNLNS
jgi:ureidoglycolate hydrolase